jgi:hypothetical protein
MLFSVLLTHNVTFHSIFICKFSRRDIYFTLISKCFRDLFTNFKAKRDFKVKLV